MAADFAAACHNPHSVRTSYEAPLGLANTLLPYIERAEWEVVAQLAFQMKGRATEGAADVLLLRAIDYARTTASDGAAVTVAAFVCGCLRFIVPRPSTTEEVATTITRYVLERAKATSDSASSWMQVLGMAMVVTAENLEPVRDGVMQAIEEKMADGNTNACELALGLDWTIRGVREADVPGAVAAYWRDARRTLIEQRRETLLRAIGSDVVVASAACSSGVISWRELLDKHGLQGLVVPHRSTIWHWGGLPGAYEFLARAALGVDSSRPQGIDFGEVARVMLGTPTPWVSQAVARAAAEVSSLTGVRSKQRYRAEEADAVFVGFCISAVIAELQTIQARGSMRPASWPSEGTAVASAVAARTTTGLDQDVDLEALERLLDERQFGFMAAWVRGELSLVAM